LKNPPSSTIVAQNIAHQAFLQELTVQFTTAGQLFVDLAALDSDSATVALLCTLP
jgi:hypothetical protein